MLKVKTTTTIQESNRHLLGGAALLFTTTGSLAAAAADAKALYFLILVQEINHLPLDRNNFVGPLGHTQYMVALNTIAIYVFVQLTVA